MSLYPVLIPLSLVSFFSLISDQRLSRDHSVTFWKGIDFSLPCAQMLTDIYTSPSQIGQMQPFERWAVCTWMTTEMPALTIDAPHALHNTCCPRETSLSETSSPMLANHPVQIHLGKNSLLWEGATSTRPWKLVCMLVWLLVWPQDSIGPKTAFYNVLYLNMSFKMFLQTLAHCKVDLKATIKCSRGLFFEQSMRRHICASKP